MIKVDYLQARDYIANGNSGKIVLGLDRVRKLCEFLGNPQDKVKLIHISGTNGKGSVGTFIASVLTASGYKVGRYTSPDAPKADHHRRKREGPWPRIFTGDPGMSAHHRIPPHGRFRQRPLQPSGFQRPVQRCYEVFF